MTLSLIKLYSQSTVNNVSQFASFAIQLNVNDLIKGYKELIQRAPHRHETEKKYFVEEHEIFLGHENSNRREEHLAGALFNECKYGHKFKLPDGSELNIMDYQFPLQAHKGDKSIGKIDLFGVIDGVIPCIIELKVAGKDGGKADTPLRAFLEGLAYCAIVESNIESISQEAKERGLKFKKTSLCVIVLAPENYWGYYLNKKAAGNWIQALKNLTNAVSKELNIQIRFLSMINADCEWKGGQPVRLNPNCKFTSVGPLEL
jgi:hypothetical protein